MLAQISVQARCSAFLCPAAKDRNPLVHRLPPREDAEFRRLMLSFTLASTRRQPPPRGPPRSGSSADRAVNHRVSEQSGTNPDEPAGLTSARSAIALAGAGIASRWASVRTLKLTEGNH